MTTKRLRALCFLLLILGTAIMGLGGYLHVLPRQYQATALVRPDPEISPIPRDDSPPEAYGDYFIQTEFEVLQSELILDPAIESLHLRESWAQQFHLPSPLKTSEARALLKHQLQVKPIANTHLIGITITTPDPNEAAQLANAIADNYARYEERMRLNLAKSRLAKQQKDLLGLDQQLTNASNNVSLADSNPHAITQLQKDRENLANQIYIETGHLSIGHSMPFVIDRAEPPTQPSDRIHPIATSLIALSFLSLAIGLLSWNRARKLSQSTN